jgi:Ca2+-binding RTX toxin-like protein
VQLPKGFELFKGLRNAIEPGESDTLTVLMPTVKSGTLKGTIRIANNDPNESSFRIKVSGTVTRTKPVAAKPKIALFQGGSRIGNNGTVNVGTVTAGGAARSITLTVRNDGNGSLAVGTVRAPNGFTITKQPPRTLAAKRSGTFTIRLNASGPGDKGGQIRIGSSPSLTFNVRGTVRAPAGGGGGCGGGGGGGDNINASLDRDGTLHVVGGSGADTITVRGTGTSATVTINAGTKTFNSVKRIAVRGGDGNDNINLSGISLQSAVDGGNGNDTIRGSGAADVLHGFFGNDSLIGGFGADQIFGDDGDDSLDAVDGTADTRVDGGNGNDVIKSDPTDTRSGT